MSESYTMLLNKSICKLFIPPLILEKEHRRIEKIVHYLSNELS